MFTINSFLKQSNKSKSAADLFYFLKKGLSDLCGYNRVIFSLRSDHASLELKEEYGYLSSDEELWIKRYIKKAYCSSDPMRIFGLSSVGAYDETSVLEQTWMTEKQTLCLDDAKKYGFHNRAAVCLRGARGEFASLEVSSIALTDTNFAEKKFRLALLNVIAQQFYSVFCEHFTCLRTIEQPFYLTSQELRVLRLIAMAKNDYEISNNMGISKHTVDFHIRNILRKLKVVNRTAAVLRAIQAGAIALPFSQNTNFRRK